MTATATQPKPDNLFGVCAALGEDLGVNPLWLRIALGAGILWNPFAMVAIYAGMGVVVVATRLLFPNRKPAAATEQPAPHPLPEPANSEDPALAWAA